MWSLPDINRMNAVAAQAGERLAVSAGNLLDPDTGTPAVCDYCADRGEQVPALYPEVLYDIFSDDPKDVRFQCQACYDYGTPEGYFYCSDCERTMVENYTWELYYTVVAGEQICLNCAADRVVADPDNWISLAEESIAGLDFEQVRQAPHIIAVGGPHPKGLEFCENVELDGSTGGRLTSSSTSEAGPAGGVAELRDILRQAREGGHTEALLILDAAYQFSVSIGVYVRESKVGSLIRSLAGI